MEPIFVEKPEMILVGLIGCSSDVSQLDIHGLWQRFTEHSKNIKHQIEGKAYELHIEEETLPKMHFCLAGVEVHKIEDTPIELFAKVSPPCRYAVFTHHFSDGGFGHAFKFVYDWIDESEYTAAYHFDIQCYDERFKGPDNPESVMEIYVPIF
jgi:predicted transcriptional regulator YdeE